MAFEDKSKYGVFPAGIGIDGNKLGVISTIEVKTVDAVIANGAALSGIVDIGEGWVASKVLIPGAITGTKLTFQISPDGVTFYNLKTSAGAELEPAMAASDSISLGLTEFMGIRYLKLRTGTSGAPTLQAAERTLKVIAVR